MGLFVFVNIYSDVRKKVMDKTASVSACIKIMTTMLPAIIADHHTLQGENINFRWDFFPNDSVKIVNYIKLTFKHLKKYSM